MCQGHDVGGGASIGPGGEVQVVLPCSMLYIFAYLVSVVVGMLVLCCWSCGLCSCIDGPITLGLQSWICV